MKYTVYTITNNNDNKVYVGFTSQDIKSRIKSHIGNKAKTKINTTIAEIGIDNFTIEIILESSNYNECKNIENELITKFDSIENGYNDSHRPNFTEESSLSRKQKLTGIKRSEETKLKYSLAKKGENHPLYGKFGKDNPNYGKQRKEGTGKNISEAKIKAGELRRLGLLEPRKKREPGYVPSEEAIKNMKDAKKTKYINVKIQNPSGDIITLNDKDELSSYLADNKLNNFMSIMISKKRPDVKGFRLISYELNPEYNGNR